MRKATTAAALVVTLLLTACTGGDEADRGARSLVGQGGGLAAAAALIAFDACDDLLGYVREVGGEQVGPYGLEAPRMVVTDAMEMRAADTAAGADGAAPAPMAAEQAAGDAAGLAADAGFSTTNVQEEGVDEPDTAKTDGRLLVAVAQVAPGPDAQDPYARVPALQVLDVSGDEPRLMGSLPLEGWDQQLLLAGDRVLVISRSTWEEAPAAARPQPLLPDQGWLDVTRVDTVSLADPAAPEVVGTRLVEGSYVNARLVDGVVRLVTRSQPKGLAFTSPQSADARELERAEAANRRVLAESTVDHWLPHSVALDGDGGVVARGRLLECDQVSRPAEPHGLGVLTVQTLDVASGEPAGPPTAVVADGDTVYASRDTLYVALSGGFVGRPMPLPMPVEPLPEPAPLPEPQVPEGERVPLPEPETVPEPVPLPDQPLPVEPDGGAGGGADGAPPEVAPAERAPDTPVGSDTSGGNSASSSASISRDTAAVDLPLIDRGDVVTEPAEPSPAVPPEAPTPPAPEAPVPETPGPETPAPTPEVTTEIHAFDISDPRTAAYVASGEVEGTLLNQFAMSEHDGHLRIATTLPFGADGAGESESVVTVLARDGDRLEQVGRVSGLGRTERIYAVRFIGPVGYVVTFRETDPLYTIDLSEPTAPRVVGELKIPGYSAYLHPLDEGRLLGVGQDATGTGQRLGAQASLFDVSDPAAPERLDQVSLGQDTQTEVEFDHHAFLWWPDAGLAVLPVTDWNRAPGDESASAAVALRVDPAGSLTEAGRITHPVAGPPQQRLPRDEGLDERPMVLPEITPIRRSLVVGDLLYTISDAGVKASDLDTLADVAWLPF